MGKVDDLWGKKDDEEFRVYVVGGGLEYIRMFYERGWKGACGPHEADLICFTGGADVDPQLYGEKPLKHTNFHPARDKAEIEIYAEAKMLEIPCVGICRGGQFLNVMNGGRMWQHVNNHAIGAGHELTDVITGKTLRVTSTHHQMMRPAAGAVVLATAKLSTLKMAYGVEDTECNEDDIEVVWYDDTSCLCFQPHPEFGNADGDCRDYFFDLLDDFIMPLIADYKVVSGLPTTLVS